VGTWDKEFMTMSNSMGIGTFIPPGLTSFGRRYPLPDKAVQSQVLMYRQLLHTECKSGLRLSRAYESTAAQYAVKHMPWWEHGVETTKRMVISYDNLMTRLWLNGCVMPYVDGGYAEEHSTAIAPKDDIASFGSLDENNYNNKNRDIDKHESHVDTLINSDGLPPIPHPHWVDRLGFQQTDPVTDFRSGGVLSLAMLVHIVEMCPNVHARFLPSGDTHMLPFGITCINVTDMIAKFCMFAKSTHQYDAIMSQKPFWRMFHDPNCLLVLQELGMDILCDVVVELGRERTLTAAVTAASARKNAGGCCYVNTTSNVKEDMSINDNVIGGKKRFQGQDMECEVSVFDFVEIISRTEKRVGSDLLGSGPKSVDDLRQTHSRLSTRYMKAIDRKERQAYRQAGIDLTSNRIIKKNKIMSKASSAEPVKGITENVRDKVGNVLDSAGDVLYKFKGLAFLPGSGGTW